MSVLDWRWRHGSVSGPLHGAVATTAAWQIGTLPIVDLDPMLVLGGGLAGSGLAVVRSRYVPISGWHLTYRIACIQGATGWLAHILDAGWSAPMGWTLLGGTALASVLYRPAKVMDTRAEERAEEEALRAADEAEQDMLHGLADQWIARFTKICRVPGCKVIAIKHWRWPGPDGQPRETGYTLEVLLPTTGATWRSIGDHADSLEAAADLPEGCGIEVGYGKTKRRALVEVATHDALRDDMPYIPATAPSTIAEPKPIGVVRNGSPALINLLYESTVLAGAKRSGKTNELLALIGRILECNDTLICVIDYNGGAVALPWMAPWAKGEINQSPILWVADTPEEARLMCAWLQEVITFRKRHYHADNARRNDDKIAPTPATPHVVLLTDEFKSVDRDIKNQIIDINDRGGGAGVTTLTCSLGATDEFIPVALLNQAFNRMAMRCNDESALARLFEWKGGKNRAKPEDAPATGYGHFRSGPDLPKVFKGPRVTPAIVEQVAVTTSAWRPPLDDPTRRMSPDWERIFTQRWDRSAHLVAAARGDHATAPSQPTGPAMPERPDPPDHRPSLDDALGGLRDAAARLDDIVNAAGGPVDDGFEEIVAYGMVPALLLHVLHAFGDQQRMHTTVIADKLGVHPNAVGSLLAPLNIRPLKNAFALDGQSREERSRGYARHDIETAIEEIKAGRLKPPPEVANWRPKPSK